MAINNTIFFIETVIALIANWVSRYATKKTLGKIVYEPYYFPDCLSPHGYKIKAGDAPVRKYPSDIIHILQFFAYLFLGIGIIMIFWGVIPMWKSLNWKDILWVSALLSFLGKRQFDLAYSIISEHYIMFGEFTGEGQGTQMFGILLMISGLAFGLFASDGPAFVMTLFDFIP